MDSNIGHVVLFPFMSKGHTIPLLHLARLFIHRRLSVTVFTTPANRPFIDQHLSDTTAAIIDLPFPQDIPDIPPGVESTDKLPSISLYSVFATATKLMQPHFEQALQILPRVSFIVSDGFLWWTLDSASKFGIPRFVFYGMNNYTTALTAAVIEDQLLVGPHLEDEPITVPQFPWIKITKNDFDLVFRDLNRSTPHSEFTIAAVKATADSHGLIVNSFYELESTFFDFCKKERKPEPWCVGPLCLASPQKVIQGEKKAKWVQWLDEKLTQGSSVLYVAFGSQSEISSSQLKEIETGLEESGVNFMWVMRKEEKVTETRNEFEERVRERGIVVREWVDQREILMHESVKGFLSHCGWNSVLESVCAGVPILAWPLMADQFLNARVVEEEAKIGLRVETFDGSVRGFVKAKGLEKMVKELMEGEMGKEVRKKVKEVAGLAKRAMEEDGSSWNTFNLLIDETCQRTDA